MVYDQLSSIFGGISGRHGRAKTENPEGGERDDFEMGDEDLLWLACPLFHSPVFQRGTESTGE